MALATVALPKVPHYVPHPHIVTICSLYQETKHRAGLLEKAFFVETS